MVEPRRMLRGLGAIVVTLAIAPMLAGCGGGGASEHAARTQRILRVPARYKTIQAAVDASRPGDLVLVSAGVYREAVTVTPAHPRITIRGLDRNRVILDGERARLVTGIAVHGDDVAVENLTIRHYEINGLVFAPSSGYERGRTIVGWRGSYVTAYDNGLYGVYAFQARQGEFDHVYASGHPDSGIYVGQCRPCDAVVTDSIAADNSVGYEETNAGGVAATRLDLRENRIGALLDSALKEKLPPQSKALFAGNVVRDNDNPRTPAGDQGFGSGIVIAGGDQDVVARNLVSGHMGAGIVVIDASAGSGGYAATDNRIFENRLARNGVDLALLTTPGSNGNCFERNHPARTVPRALERVAPCGRSVGLRGNALTLPRNPRGARFLTIPAPGPQPSMPAAATAPPRLPTGSPPAVALSSIRTPTG